MEYIKKLRLCIKWFEDLEDGLNQEKLKLQSTIESLEKQCAELGNCLRPTFNLQSNVLLLLQ